MSTTTLGITVMMKQTEKKQKLMLNETLTQLFLGGLKRTCVTTHMALAQAEV